MKRGKVRRFPDFTFLDSLILEIDKDGFKPPTISQEDKQQVASDEQKIYSHLETYNDFGDERLTVALNFNDEIITAGIASIENIALKYFPLLSREKHPYKKQIIEHLYYIFKIYSDFNNTPFSLSDGKTSPSTISHRDYLRKYTILHS